METENKILFERIKALDKGIDPHVEYGSWMIELVPTEPITKITEADKHIDLYHDLANSLLFDRETPEDLKIIMTSAFPMMGKGNYIQREDEIYDKF